MFLSITCNHSGEDLLLRRLSPSESLDVRTHVNTWIEDHFGEIEEPVVAAFSEPGAHIPQGCADYQAEIRDTKAPGATCWDGEPFFVVPDETCAQAA